MAGVYEFTQNMDADLDEVKASLQSIDAASDVVTVTGSVGAGASVASEVISRGNEKLALVVSGLAASLTVEVRLLDENSTAIHTLSTITANGLTVVDVAWPRVQVVRKNASAAAATITVSYALR